jgi:hypothetical protein
MDAHGARQSPSMQGIDGTKDGQNQEVKGCQFPEGAAYQLLEDDKRISNQQGARAQIVQPYDRMQAHDVREAADDVDEIRTSPT